MKFIPGRTKGRHHLQFILYFFQGCMKTLFIASAFVTSPYSVRKTDSQFSAKSSSNKLIAASYAFKNFKLYLKNCDCKIDKNTRKFSQVENPGKAITFKT